jgi:hypothetical protein
MQVRNFRVLNRRGKYRLSTISSRFILNFSIPTRSALVQQPTQIAPIKRLASNTPVAKARTSTLVKSQCSYAMTRFNRIYDAFFFSSSSSLNSAAYNIPRASTVTVTAPVVSQLKKVRFNFNFDEIQWQRTCLCS